MTKSNIEETLQKQSLIFYYPGWARAKNTIFINFVIFTLFLFVFLFLAWIPLLFSEDFFMHIQMMFPAILIYCIFYFGIPIFILYRLYDIRRHWHDLIIITSDGIHISNKLSQSRFYSWSEFTKIRGGIWGDELRLITANRENPLRIDKTLKDYKTFKTLAKCMID